MVRVGGLEASAGGTRRKPPWLVLSLGFGGLLVFIVAAATGTLVVLDRVRHQENPDPPGIPPASQRA